MVRLFVYKKSPLVRSAIMCIYLFRKGGAFYLLIVTETVVNRGYKITYAISS